MYINDHETIPKRIALIEMGHPQMRTPMKTNNLAAHSVVKKNIQPRRKKGDKHIFPLVDVSICPR